MTGVDGKAVGLGYTVKAVNQRVPAGQFIRMEIEEPMERIPFMDVLGKTTSVGYQIVLTVIGIRKARRLVPLFRQM